MNQKKISSGDIVVLGVPFDDNSSFLKGPAAGPGKIIASMFIDSTNLWTEQLLDLGSEPGWHLLPDIDFTDDGQELDAIEKQLDTLLKRDLQVIALGGDHSITLPIIRAYARAHSELNILHFDAHPDLYDTLDGNRLSHACPFARIMEEGLAARLVQVGIRTLTGHQKRQAERFGVEIIDMKNIEAAKQLSFAGPVYLSLDLDCLDPAFAPGVSHHEPGGMSSRDVLDLIQNLNGKLVGADIVEYNPDRDFNNMTGMVAAKLLKELIGRMLETKKAATDHS